MKVKRKNGCSFPSGKFYLNFPSAGVMGVPRSGKTTLGNLLATNRNVEYCDEPWLLGALPAMVKFGMINKEIGKDMYTAYLHELMNEMILLRQANFRPNDESSIWTKKTDEEIFSRLTSLQSRSDVVNFVKKNKSLFLMTLSESSLFNFQSIFDFLPDFKVIHMIRRGIDVAYQIEEKGHFSNQQLLKPPHARLYYRTMYKGKVFYVPCWVDVTDKEKFLAYSPYERGLFFWCALVGRAIESSKRFKNTKQLMTIKFEELIENPGKITQMANVFINAKPSSMTKTALYKIQNYNTIVFRKAPVLSDDLLIKTKKIYEHFKYEWN